MRTKMYCEKNDSCFVRGFTIASAQISVIHCKASIGQKDEASEHSNLANRAAIAAASSGFNTRINFWQRQQEQK